jgi:hypothetical protein
MQPTTQPQSDWLASINLPAPAPTERLAHVARPGRPSYAWQRWSVPHALLIAPEICAMSGADSSERAWPQVRAFVGTRRAAPSITRLACRPRAD